VHEQWERRHVKRQSLRLPRPIKERLAQCLQMRNGVGEAVNDHITELPGLGELMWRDQGGGLLDLSKEPLTEFAGGVLAIPVECR